MDILLVIILSICGVALLVVEIFLIPGIGFAGIAGIAGMVAAVVCAYHYIGAMAGHITLASLLVLTAIATWVITPTIGLTSKLPQRRNSPTASSRRTTIHSVKPTLASTSTARVLGRTVSRATATVRSTPVPKSSTSIPTRCAGFTTIASPSMTR